MSTHIGTSKFGRQRAAIYQLMTNGQYLEAANRWERFCRKNKANYHDFVNLAICRTKGGDLVGAEKAFQQALRKERKDPVIWKALGANQIQQGKMEDAVISLRNSLALKPGNAQATGLLASALERLNRMDEFWELLEPFIESNTCDPHIVASFSRQCHHRACCDKALQLIRSALGQTDMGHEDKILLSFRLGALLDRSGRYEEAFMAYREANFLKRARFDRQLHQQKIDRTIATCTKVYMENAPKGVIKEERLVFIVGMPRSGTTLLEQILSAHPQVHGAGERPELLESIPSLSKSYKGGMPYMYHVDSLTPRAASQLADSYLRSAVPKGNSALRIIDKMPLNFLILPLIQVLFPGARILHIRRNPIATCLSCFFNDFAHTDSMSWSYDLTNLGSFYNDYQRLMEHWVNVVTVPILNINYEDLVTDTTAQIRKILHFLDLPWSEECLSFFEKDNLVLTASYDQVRQPIYSTSLEHWKHYESYLKELIDQLGCGHEH